MSNDVAEIKSKLDIVQIVSEYVNLKQAGTNFKGLCPFHNEKTPSFMVSSDKQIFHCFGCSKGGDMFTFIQEIETCEFPEALRILAKKAGVQIKKFDPKITNQKTRLLDINELAAKFFNYLLYQPAGKKALDYLYQRQLTDNTIQDFYLGYSPDSWDKLMNFLRSKGYFEKEIFDAGLVVQKDNNRGYYDRFRHRVMFPIKNIFGQVVGFTARVLDGDEKTAKYINTPQTLIYNKSQVIFGLDKAKREIKNKDLAVVVEGNMDVIASYQAGIKNVVASSGTALTADQVQTLKRYSNNLALSFDADAAGQAAAERGIDIALSHGLNIKVITLTHKDPDDCIKQDPKLWIQSIENAQPYLENIFQKITVDKDLNNIDHKKQIADQMLIQIKKITNKVEQDIWLQKLGSYLDVSQDVLRESLKTTGSRIKNSVSQSKKQTTEQTMQPKNHQTELYDELFGLVLKYPKNLDYLIEHFTPEYISDQEFSKLYKFLILYYNDNNKNDNMDFLDDFINWLSKTDSSFATNNENKLQKLILLIEKDFYSFTENEIQQEIVNVIRTIKRQYFTNKTKQIRIQIQQLEANPIPENKEKLSELSQEFNLLVDKLIEVQ